MSQDRLIYTDGNRLQSLLCKAHELPAGEIRSEFLSNA